MKRIEINNLQEVYNALEQNVISPQTAIDVISKALKMINVSFGKKLVKEDVLKQIKKLDTLIKENNTVPLCFWQQNKDFRIADICGGN